MNNVKLNLGKYENEFSAKLVEFNNEKIMQRIWKKDFTVWRENPTEISNRLGWLDCSDVANTKFNEINEFVEQVKSEGFTHALLLGMGGSSLAPEVFKKVFGVKTGYLDLSILDSTHPDQVQAMIDKYSKQKTLFIVSTKSGGTVETISFMKRFYNSTLNIVGNEIVGQRFIAITDPGSGLEQMAKDLKFRKIFINDPNIGGRYSALSLFGLVPAALLGVNLSEFISLVDVAIAESIIENNVIAKIGVAIGTLAKQGVDKVTFILSDNLKPFGAWAEQLIAESTGKEGKGILPIEGEENLLPENYSFDRLFVNIHLKDDSKNANFISNLTDAGFSVLELELDSIYELGAQFFIWEMATVIASWIIDIQPYDQPNVEQAKIIGRKMMSQYLEEGQIAKLTPNLEDNGIKVYGDVNTHNLLGVIPEFMNKLNSGENNISGRSYVSIQAYVNMNDEAEAALRELRTNIQKKYKVATTVGFGPRFLHSTGQLHKGDSGNGLFIQIVSKNRTDVEIPNEAGNDKSDMTFNVLVNAQALGDRQALLDNKRNVIRFDISENVKDDIRKLF
ncbi:MAG: glucose-6-phosphate isomerase [Bacteroidetes bacterium]|nr:glucose-6-phosphate isomerase [Bacteroidota bacterium]MBU1113508.1 glucose-6-phosphate isomerase [Bacteroidota bacterium]MBU1797042.1 glucose-6-phosphate isomerase [Bacteroidota bacterium]